MVKSKVYFTNMRSVDGECLTDKLVRLCRTAGIGKIDFKDKFTAIKLHFGEDGNLAFLRADYARAVVDLVKALGGRPFVTDANTLYVGSRKNALDHLDVAYRHGFNPLSLGCHTIIADGLKGTDEVEVPIDGEYVKSAKIGKAVMDADVLISLTHFKGHEATGFGGALKNLGMGSGSFAGKKEMHSGEKPKVQEDVCVGCGRCVGVCPTGAMIPAAEDALSVLARKVAEYAYAVCKDRPCFHISLLIDVSPFCDCYGSNDAPVIPNVGMFASFDPVALDKACADAANRQHALADSLLGELHPAEGADHFHTMHPDTDWEAGIAQAEKLGLGTADYELVTMI